MKMHAVGYRECLPVDDPNSLIDLELDRPTPSGRDLLVEIRAVSVNPVDVKLRARESPAEGPRILGFDGAGIVVATGAEARLFRPGDAVFYAGSVRRSGTNAQFHLVDERIVGRKPGNISFAEAAALPLTTLTASELLFDRIGVATGPEADRRSLLVIGGAGGVGSIAIQIARRLTGLTVIATASRTQTRDWCLAMGAHHVIDHSQPMQPQLAAAGFADVDIVLGLTASDRHLPEIAKIIAPQGRLGVIDDIKGFDITAFKTKSVSIHWEYMFTRAVFGTPDIEEQHRILDRTAALIENGQLRSTLGEIVGPLDAAHLRTAHRLVESGKARGKIVLEARL
jgi:NADPH:quinone reductase